MDNEQSSINTTDGNKIYKAISILKTCNIILWILMAIKIGLTLFVMAPYLVNRNWYDGGGAGTAVAFFYFGPVMIADFIAIVFFFCISLYVSRLRKWETIRQKYKGSLTLFLILLLITIISFILLLIIH